MTMVVLELPPSDSCNILVSFESLYGIWDLLDSVKDAMTFPKQERDLLMFLASSKVSPTAPVLLTYTKAIK